MDEREWLACHDPEAMIEVVRALVSDRKARLVAIAAFRWGTICPEGVRLELAERLAEGDVTFDEAMEMEPGKESGYELSLFPRNPPLDALHSCFAIGIDLARDAVRQVLDDSALSAWGAAGEVAWRHWRETAKDPMLLDKAELWKKLVPDGLDDPWWPAFKTQYRGDLWTYARKEKEADATHDKIWDALWETRWRSAWEAAWVEGCGRRWSDVRTSIGSAELDEHWAKAIAELRERVWQNGPWSFPDGPYGIPGDFVEWFCRAVAEAEPARQAALFREIIGNPFRAVTVDPSWMSSAPATVREMAQTIYDERRFADLPELASALEEAGCMSADIVSHCRGQAPHTRGCWALDLILGKS